jgi:hypothetical protein
MKTKSFLLSALAVIMLAGCSDDAQEDQGIPGDALIGKAYLSLSLQSHATGSSSRANVQAKPGSSEESKATNVTVLLFDEDDVCIDVVDFSGTVVGNSGGNSQPEAQVSDAKLVPEKTKKVFVVINPYASGWDLSKEAVVSKLWSAINTAIDAGITNVATNDNFMMTSAGTSDKGPLTEVTVCKPTAYTTEAVNAAKESAKTNAATINVDRLSAKVQVAVQSPEITKPTGASFTFDGWELSVTNKSVRLYSDLVTYTGATTGAVYRRDKNYLVGEQPADESARNAAFYYLKNINSTAETMPDVAQTDGASQYCLENTMNAEAQQLGFTTKVVVKAHYSPNGVTANSSYFSWKGAYYTLTALKNEYKNHSVGSGLKVDLPIFLKKAKLMAEDVIDQSAIDAAVEALKDEDFDAKTGIIGRFCAVRYYHESVCYYDVLIRHDQAITTKMALGRYGVVRNNWYQIELQSVSGPGTPWIPDPSDPDPTNPTPPGTDDDESDAYLSVKIVINPWTFWKQGADLH